MDPVCVAISIHSSVVYVINIPGSCSESALVPQRIMNLPMGKINQQNKCDKSSKANFEENVIFVDRVKRIQIPPKLYGISSISIDILWIRK